MAGDAELGRLRWRCRRGMRELDLLLMRYLERDWPAADASERAAFERLLETPDPELAAWCFGRATPGDPAIGVLVGKLLDASR